MRTFKLNKLVRDKIVDYHLKFGEVDYRVLKGREYLESLKTKILEEAQEMDVADAEHLFKELADLQEVIDCILTEIGKTKRDLEVAQAKKNQKSGSFKKKHFINTVTLPSDNEWAQYYAKDPGRFPEIKS